MTDLFVIPSFPHPRPPGIADRPHPARRIGTSQPLLKQAVTRPLCSSEPAPSVANQFSCQSVQLSIGEEVRPQSVLGDILACLPEDGAQGAGVEMTAAPERRRSLGMDRFQFQGDDQWCVLYQPQFAQIFAGQVKLDRFA